MDGGAARASAGPVSDIGDVEALVTLISSVFCDRPGWEPGPLPRPEHVSLLPV